MVSRVYHVICVYHVYHVYHVYQVIYYAIMRLCGVVSCVCVYVCGFFEKKNSLGGVLLLYKNNKEFPAPKWPGRRP